MKYDLEERTTRFGERVISFLKTVKIDEITKPLVGQVVRSASSIGANYREANEASSPKDFRNKVCIGKKEANETKHWLRLISIAQPEREIEAKKLWQEAHEYVLIFGKIVQTVTIKLNG